MEEVNRETLERNLLNTINEYAKALASFRIAEQNRNTTKEEIDKQGETRKTGEEAIR